MLKGILTQISLFVIRCKAVSSVCWLCVKSLHVLSIKNPPNIAIGDEDNELMIYAFVIKNHYPIDSKLSKILKLAT